MIFFLFGAIISAAGAGGLISFACAGVLLMLGTADQKKAIAAVPWSTIILICGMSVLISVINTCGGICVGCAPESVDKDKLYNQLLLAAVSFIVMSVVLSFIGVFRSFG